MAEAGDSSFPVAGSPSTSQPVDEIKEYEKILRISDEIFAGTHPRLKVPQQFVRKVPSRTLQPSVAPVVVDRTGSQQSTITPAEPSLSRESHTPHIQTSSSVASPASALSSVAPKPAPGIDPIFLTKSDDLVRAEIQLQRRKIENLLKEQVERSKNETRLKATNEIRPEFDVSEVLNRALEIVKPLPSPDGLGTNDAMIPSDSVDENSLYSSRAPDSPLTWDYEKQAPSEPDRLVHGQTENIIHHVDGRRVADAGPHTLQASTDKAILPQGRNQPVPTQTKQPQEELALDEPEYSPPEATMPLVEETRVDEDDYQPPEVLDSTRHNGFIGVKQVPLQQSKLSPDVRVVRNHITSPAAPQPSRVSPLATAKGLSVQRMLHIRSSPHEYNEGGASDLYSEQTSPEGPQQQLLPRKRRRVQEPNTMSSKSQTQPHTRIVNGEVIIDNPPPAQIDRRPRDRAETRLVDTSETRVKLEPVSPPPFHDTPPRTHKAPGHPVYIDISSPRYAPSVDRREVISREPFYELERYGSSGHEFAIPVEGSVRAVSRVSTRRPVRDNQDLRRVASLHNARNPDNAPREFVEPVLRPQSARPSPLAAAERHPNEKTTYYEDVAPTYSRRYPEYGDYPPSSSSRYREYYVDDGAIQRYVEPPTPRRIVVDEYGNQYYEMVPASKIRPAPMPARVVRPEEYAERAYIRSASVRAPSIIDDGYGNRRYVQEMAPPSGTFRRVTEHGRNVSESQRLYPARQIVGRESVLRSGSVTVDYVPQQATYIEEEIPRERLVRAASVRPASGRFEQHREGLHHVESVRPSGREVSVYMDENGHHVAREHSERPGYSTVRPERESRYITEEDGTRLAIGGAREVVHRVAPRY